MNESLRTPSGVSRRKRRTSPAAVVHNTLVSLMTCLCFACAARQESRASCPAIEMSAVADAQTDSTKSATMLNDTTTILMSRSPIVTTSDITGAAPSASQLEGQWVVNFTVTDDAATRVQEFTRQHVGTRMALVVDGKVHGAPRIAGAIVGNRYQIDGFNQADAERLSTAITNGCRR
jgi:preprotein translocase subunit SecD